GNIVLSSLAELSIRYHTLATTSPNIVDSLQLLTGRLDLDTIKTAGIAKRHAPRWLSNYDVDRILPCALEVQTAVRRSEFWEAEGLLQLMRLSLIDIFGYSRGHSRPCPAFESNADEALQNRLGKTLPQQSLESIEK